MSQTIRLALFALLFCQVATAAAQKPQGYYLNAINSVNAGELDQAFGEVNKALELDPGHAQSLVLRAYLLMAAGDKAGALADYTAALKSAPTDLGALTNRALLLMEMERYEEALVDLKKRIKQDPYNWMAHYDLAYCYGLQEQHDLAITGFTEVIKRNEEYADAYMNRGFARYNKHSNMGLTRPGAEVMAQVCEDFKQALKLGHKEASAAVKKYCE